LYFETLRQGVAMEDAAIIEELVYALQQYGDHPAFLRHDNKPVLFIWASGRVTAERWKTILAAVRQQAGPALFIGMGCDTLDLDVFDGVHDYTVNAPTDLPRYQRLCGNKTRHHFLLSPSGGRKLWAATAMPGYDDRALTQRAEHLLIPRDSGAYYRHTLQAALDSQPDWLLVTSWNEWGENTHIENSVVYGDLYERLTREYTAPWLANR
ncbi:MAG TPA: glycoside hydrolase family 99-like domain-containing protein, partial [Candidatus Kapabacteria bacterium]|nr:glycoside hydrolase family 99-like domain-containing protein [Candidatus Kapabacteria bacterium]